MKSDDTLLARAREAEAHRAGSEHQWCQIPNTRDHFNIKMSYQYRNSNDKDKTFLRPSYLWHRNPMGLYVKTDPRLIQAIVFPMDYQCDETNPPRTWGLQVSWPRNLLHSLQWRHNHRDGASSHQPQDCLLNRLFRRKSKKASTLRVTGLCEENSPVTGEFPAQKGQLHGKCFDLITSSLLIGFRNMQRDASHWLFEAQWRIYASVHWQVFI